MDIKLELSQKTVILGSSNSLENLSEINSFNISKKSINRIEDVFKRADLVKFAKSARLNSTRLPNKLLRDICGKTLIRRTYEATKNSSLFDDVLVVTNSEEILKELKNNQIKFLFDKNQYETGTDRIAGIASDINADIIINVQGDEPFINAKTIKLIINVFKNDFDKSIGIVSVMTPISDDLELNNPNNVKVITDKANNAIYFSRYPIPFKRNINTS